MFNMMKSIFSHKATLDDIKKQWSESHYKSLSPAGVASYEISYKYCEALHKKSFVDIKYDDWQSVMDSIRERGLHFGSQKKLKNLIGQLYTYANKKEITSVNYASMMEMDKNIPVYEKTPFDIEEIRALWKYVKVEPQVDAVLILIYTGLRISELLRVDKNEDVFLDTPGKEYLIVRHSKTAAGTGRVVPIHKEILPLVKKYMKYDCARLISYNNKPISYSLFRYKFVNIMRDMNFDHTIHECRHTFATLLDAAGVNNIVIKKIIGHACTGVTNKVYIHKNLDDLFTEMQKLKIK